MVDQSGHPALFRPAAIPVDRNGSVGEAVRLRRETSRRKLGRRVDFRPATPCAQVRLSSADG